MKSKIDTIPNLEPFFDIFSDIVSIFPTIKIWLPSAISSICEDKV